MIPFWYYRVSPQTELDDDNARNEKETKKLDSEQNSKEKVKSSVQGLAPGLGYDIFVASLVFTQSVFHKSPVLSHN